MTLFLVSEFKQKYQKCHLLCQISGPVTLLSHIRTLDWMIMLHDGNGYYEKCADNGSIDGGGGRS